MSNLRFHICTYTGFSSELNDLITQFSGVSHLYDASEDPDGDEEFGGDPGADGGEDGEEGGEDDAQTEHQLAAHVLGRPPSHDVGAAVTPEEGAQDHPLDGLVPGELALLQETRPIKNYILVIIM